MLYLIVRGWAIQAHEGHTLKTLNRFEFFVLLCVFAFRKEKRG